VLVVSFVDAAVARLPRRLQELAVTHHELAKFTLVGGTTFIVDTVAFYGLKSSVLEAKPVTAKVIAVLVATILSYVLNREWSFKSRGGREAHHEAALFFAISGVGMAINAAPLWVSSYVFDLRVPNVSSFEENVADFISAQIIGTLLAMAFRWWAFRKFVFLEIDVGEAAVTAAEAAVPEPIADELAEEELGHG
jgi:putative flippase GtrA